MRLKGKKLIIILVVAVSLLFVVVFGVVARGCNKNKVDTVAASGVPVELTQAFRGDIAGSARVTGLVTAGSTVQATFAAPGKLKTVLVNVGDKVSQGQIIAKLESSELEARLNQARAGLEQARTGPEQYEPRVRQSEAQAQLDEDNL